MQESSKNQPAPKNTSHKLELDHTHGASMTGVFAVPTFTDKLVSVRLKDETLLIVGRDLEIKSLDVENGKLSLSGTIVSLKYQQSGQGLSLAKRIFK